MQQMAVGHKDYDLQVMIDKQGFLDICLLVMLPEDVSRDKSQRRE